MRFEEYTFESILNEAEMLAKKSPVDPVPELANDESLPHRAETMRAHFTLVLNDLMEKFRAMPKEAREGLSEPEMRNRIANALEQGYESLVRAQPSFRHSAELQHDIDDILAFIHEMFDTIREPEKPYPERHQFSGGRIDYRLPDDHPDRRND